MVLGALPYAVERGRRVGAVVGILIFSSVDPLGVGIRNANIVVFGAVVGANEKRQKAARIAARLIVYFLCCGCIVVVIFNVFKSKFVIFVSV